MRCISLIDGLLLLLNLACSARAAPVNSVSELDPCFDAGQSDCRSTLRASKDNWLLSEVAKRSTDGLGSFSNFGSWQTHVRSANQQSSNGSSKAPSPKTIHAGFIFDEISVRHSAKPGLFVRIAEKISRNALKRRFADYDVHYTEGEGCLICATISGQDGRFEVGFDQTGQTVIDLRSTDDRVRDRLGNEVGSPLRNGLGAEAATCDAGESMTCASPLIKGLSYLVIEDDHCSVIVKDQRPTRIPTCARIGGFQIILNEKRN